MTSEKPAIRITGKFGQVAISPRVYCPKFVIRELGPLKEAWAKAVKERDPYHAYFHQNDGESISMVIFGGETGAVKFANKLVGN